MLMNLEDIMQSEVPQTQKDKYCMSPLIGGELRFREKRMVAAEGRGHGELFNGYRVSGQQGEKVLEVGGGGACTTV